MKKTIAVIISMLLAVFVMSSSVSVAYAAEAPNSDPVKARSTQQTKLLTNAGEYYGWSAGVKPKSETPGKIVTSITLRNSSRYVFRVTQTTQRKSDKYVISYVRDGQSSIIPPPKQTSSR